MQNIDGNMHPLWQSLSDRNQVSRYKLQMPKEQNAPPDVRKFIFVYSIYFKGYEHVTTRQMSVKAQPKVLYYPLYTS